MLSRIFGVEQTDVHLVCRQQEIVTQHTIVKQQLHIVRFLIGIGSHGWQLLHQSLDVPVLARLLLHQQTHIVGHQVDTSLQSQALTDKRGLYQCPLDVVGVADAQSEGHGDRFMTKEHIHSLADVGFLLEGIGFEARPVESRTGTKLQDLLAERPAQRVGKRGVGMVYQVVERCTGEITQEDGLCVGTRLEPVEEIAHGVVTIVLETGSHRRDVYQEVGLYHHQARNHGDRFVILFRIRQPVPMIPAIQQVELHAFGEVRGER